MKIKQKTVFKNIAVKYESYETISKFCDLYNMKIYGAFDMLLKLGLKEFNKVNENNELFEKDEKEDTDKKYYITITQNPACNVCEVNEYFVKEHDNYDYLVSYVEKNGWKLNQYVQVENKNCGDCLNKKGICYTNIYTQIKESN